VYHVMTLPNGVGTNNYYHGIQPAESSPHSSTLRSCRCILIISSHMLLDISRGLFLSGFSTKDLHTIILPLTHNTCPSNSLLLELIVSILFYE
jgi:hypothetical protein